MSRHLKKEIETHENDVIRALTCLAERIRSGKASEAEIEIADQVLCDVNNQIAACPISKHSGDTNIIILPVKKIGKALGILIIALFLIGCSATEAHKANHEGSMIENHYLQQQLQNNPELMEHLQQQERSLMTTQDYLGTPEQTVPHDHRVQEEWRARADEDTKDRAWIKGLAGMATTQWPWIGSLIGLGGLALRWLGKARMAEKVVKRIVVGAQNAKEAADENGMLHRDTISIAVAEATSLIHDPKLKIEATRMIGEAKADLKLAKKDIERLRRPQA